ncbi:MAG: hypothetical protein WD011_02905 [Nitriliruptoraceae bacterium]
MRDDVVRLILALLAGIGAYLCVSRPAAAVRRLARRPAWVSRLISDLRDTIVQAGFPRVRAWQVILVIAGCCSVAAFVGHAVYGGTATTVVMAGGGAMVPVLIVRGRRDRRREQARDAWPALLESIRVGVSSLGQSIPIALIAAGERAPASLRPAFGAAAREWQVSTDFRRMLHVWRAHLADPTADTISETLLVAHEVGGATIDGRLRQLIDDRLRDVHARKDARARQSGVRFARAFVLAVPFGMALVGLLIGDGRAAYAAPTGQVVVVSALVLLAGCWVWASRLLVLPVERRVFADRDGRVADGHGERRR